MKIKIKSIYCIGAVYVGGLTMTVIAKKNPNAKFKVVDLNVQRIADWNDSKGYVQDNSIKQQIDLENTQVYACGSNEMIKSAKELFFKNNLKENNFFSDKFVQTNK